MKEQIEQVLTLIQNDKLSQAEIEEWDAKIRNAIKEDPSMGKELGPLYSQIRQAMKQKANKADVHWVQAGNGSLAIGHKPGGKISYAGMKSAGVTAVLTLLKENEGALLIGKELQKVKIDWLWFPFSASTPHAGDDLVEIMNLYKKLVVLLNEGSRIYIHCSAGIHRTGMITYGLLRWLGKEKNEAFQLLGQLREVTSAQVGEERLTWADDFINEYKQDLK